MRENNTTKTNKTENKELTSYQKLLITLDDDTKAYEFRVKTLDRAKALIGDILSVTTGSSVVTEYNSEWGHGHFLELFEMLSIRHKNFDVPDFIADLKEYLFTWTMKHDEEKRNWEKALLAERGLDERGIKLETPTEADNPINAPEPEVERQTEQPKAKTLEEHTLQVVANELSHTLASDKAPEAKEALQSILCEMSNESNIGIDHPELIKYSFPLLIDSLEFGHGKGFMDSLRAILDSSLVHSIEDELRQYEKRFDGRDSEFDGSPSEPDVLGL